MAISAIFGSAFNFSPYVTVIGYGAGTQGSCLTTKGVNGWMNQAMPVYVPANSVKPGGYLDVKYELSSSLSGSPSTNYFFVTLGGITVGAVTTLSSAGSLRGSLRIRNVDNSAQIATVVQGDGVVGGNLFTFGCNMAIDQQLTFWTNGGTSPNCVALKGWSVEAHNATATATPSALLSGGRKCFYGINAHIDEGNGPTIANRISAMKALGFNVLRVSWFGPTHSSGGVLATTWIQDMASAFAADSGSLGLNMMVMVSCGPNTVTATEADAYSAGFAQGVYAATNLGSKGVQLYELGNEIDADGRIRRITTTQGTTVDDFSLSSTVAWATWRGSMRGCYDGIKSVQPNAMVGSNAFTNASIWCSDALWNGTDPFGGSGNPVVRWDWTNWHLYTEGDATDVNYSSNTVRFNMLKYLHCAYNRPICITEWNPVGGTTASTVALVNTWLTTWYNHQVDYNIGGVVWFSWFDGIYAIANTATPATVNDAGAAYRDFISAHPAVK